MGVTTTIMVRNEESNDNTRRTFLQLLGVTGAATAGIGTFSTSAAAESSSTTAMKTLDLNADDLVPANKFLSLSCPGLATDEIETLNVLIDGTPASTVQMYQANEKASSVLVSVFDMMTNHSMKSGQTLPVEVEGTTTSGESFSGSDSINVIDPTNVLDNERTDRDGSASDADSESASDVEETVTEVTDTVDSTGILGKPSSKTYRQQMY